MRNKWYILLFLICWAPVHILAENPFVNVRDYGARGDGVHLDSKAINAAIESVSKNGGTVFIPGGNYLCGSIHLRSNVSLWIDQGATLIAAPVTAENGYDEAEPGPGNKYQDEGHSHWHNSLIWGEDLHDISIVGGGRIWGKGLYRTWVKDKQSANKSIALLRCRNVIIRDIIIQHGGWFGILATGVDNFTLDNVKMDTNRDGVDVDCCKNVRISNCTINSPYDDGICLKSSYGLNERRSTDNVTITNCQVSGFVEGTLLDGTYRHFDDSTHHRPTGRIKFGTESNGGFRNITISNCVFDYCGGLALESVDGALLEDVTISNISMRDVVNDPIFIRLGARMRGPKEIPVGSIRRVQISHIVVHNAHSPNACTITGIPGHPVEDISLDHINIYYAGGGTREMGERAVPEKENSYPEPGMFGANPAFGFFVRHAKNIQMSEVYLHVDSADLRPALRFDEVQGVYIHHLVIPPGQRSSPIRLDHVSDFSIYRSPGIPDQENTNGAGFRLH